MVFITTWLVATYDFNLFFNQAHHVDRIALLLLGSLILWRPVFVFPFLLTLLAIFSQFSYPFERNPAWTEFNLFARALTLFGSALILQAVTRREQAHNFVVIFCCLIASSYWGSGIGKFRLNWIAHPYVYLLPFGSYANGWLGFLEPSTIVRFTKILSYVTVPMMLFTLVIEWGSVVILFRRSLTLAFLAGFIIFHSGIFLLSGMFLWKWILLEAALFAYFLRERERVAISNWSYFVLSLILIGGSPLWFKPKNLSWYDTPVTYSYPIEGDEFANHSDPDPLSEPDVMAST